MKNKEYQYILFPLPLLQEIFKNPETGFSDIFGYGIYTTASKQNIEQENAVKQALYCFYRGGLTDSLKRKLDSLVENDVFVPDEDYNGFTGTGDEFNPEGEIESITEYLKKDTQLYDEIMEFHRLRQIKSVLNMTFDTGSVIDTHNRLQKQYNGFSKSPLVMIKTDMMFDFYKNKKTEFEKALFCAYAGIRSVIGNKKFCQTTQSMIITRMIGAKNNDALTDILKNKKVKAIYEKYSKRYHREKIMNELVARNFLSSKIFVNRRTYLSCSLNYDELSSEITKFSKEKTIKGKIESNKIKELHARSKILQHLNKAALSTTLSTTPNATL